MPQHSEQLALEVERVLREHGSKNKSLTLREAEGRTRINYTTIAAMVKGNIPRPETLAKFAIGFGEDKEFWLSLGGYEDDNLPVWTPLPEEEGERKIIQYFRQLPPKKKRLAVRVLKGLM